MVRRLAVVMDVDPTQLAVWLFAESAYGALHVMPESGVRRCFEVAIEQAHTAIKECGCDQHTGTKHESH
jgi:hypothetical protein